MLSQRGVPADQLPLAVDRLLARAGRIPGAFELVGEGTQHNVASDGTPIRSVPELIAYEGMLRGQGRVDFIGGVAEGPVPGPNPNRLMIERVGPGGPTEREGVYAKPHDGLTKVGKATGTDTFRSRYSLSNPEGGAGIEFEIPMRGTAPPAGLSPQEASYWSAARQARFDEAYVDALFPRDQIYRAPRETAPLSIERWQQYRHIFGYGDLPPSFLDHTR